MKVTTGVVEERDEKNKDMNKPISYHGGFGRARRKTKTDKHRGRGLEEIDEQTTSSKNNGGL